ncbi:hypothetical protein LXL04_005163 [Taraxacum kok-saghyz]
MWYKDFYKKISKQFQPPEVGFSKKLTVWEFSEREREKENKVQMRTIIEFENTRTNLGHLFFINNGILWRAVFEEESRSVDFPEPEGPMIAMIRDG